MPNPRRSGCAGRIHILKYIEVVDSWSSDPARTSKSFQSSPVAPQSGGFPDRRKVAQMLIKKMPQDFLNERTKAHPVNEEEWKSFINAYMEIGVDDRGKNFLQVVKDVVGGARSEEHAQLITKDYLEFKTRYESGRYDEASDLLWTIANFINSLYATFKIGPKVRSSTEEPGLSFVAIPVDETRTPQSKGVEIHHGEKETLESKVAEIHPVETKTSQLKEVEIHPVETKTAQLNEAEIQPVATEASQLKEAEHHQGQKETPESKGLRRTWWKRKQPN